MRPTIAGRIQAFAPWPLALLLTAAPALAQRTQATDAGGGRKLETTYNAANQVVETRTFGPDGKLQQKVEFEYRPGFQVPQQTSTSYWPDGETIHRQSRVEYDDNANFTSQVNTLFNAEGKQTAGNKLTHNPPTGVYHCYTWSPDSAAYTPEACPKPEEEEPEGEDHEITRAEAIKDLADARQAFRSQEKLRRLKPVPPVKPPIATLEREVGVVLPANLRAGERVSGCVTDEPGRYDGAPGLQVVRLRVTFDSQGPASTLGGWTFLASNAPPQRADGPVTFVVPRDSAEVSVTLRQTGNPAHTFSRSVAIGSGGAGLAAQPNGFESSPLCFKDALCPVRGAFSGDSTRTFAAFGKQPAPIVAETRDTAFIAVPDLLGPGFNRLLVAEGARVAALPVDIAQFELTPAGRTLQQGQTLVMHAIIEGADSLPDDLWRAGSFAPLASLEQARSLDAGFDPAKYGAEGVILAAVQNDSPLAITMRSARDHAYIFKLTRDSFARGEFKYNFVLEFKRTGGYSLRAIALPFLAPVRAREFVMGSEGAVSHPRPAR